MISLSHLNKLTLVITLLAVIISPTRSEDETPNIWENNNVESEQNEEPQNIEEGKIKSPILSDDIKKIEIKINEDKIDNTRKSVVGIIDPEVNNFNLNMWSKTDGEEIKKVLKRINKLKLSKPSEDLLFQILFTNAYPPLKNLSSEDFLKIKINWLIKKKRIGDLENFIKNNPEVEGKAEALKFLINEYLSSANIKSACEKINFINPNVQDNYLEKFKIYCMINNDRKEEAQLIFDLSKENGMNDKFFEDKINFLLGVSEKTNQKVLDNNLLNFYLSHVTNEKFEYLPSDKTDKYIWRYLSAANLIEVDNFENENVLLTYEQVAAQNSFDKDEIFKIYLKINFNFSQLANAEEIHKNLPNYEARALLYQSIMLTDNIEKKINLAILLKKLFMKDKILNVYLEELSNILKSIKPNEIPEGYIEIIKENLENNIIQKVKFNNDILHRSKVIKHFLEDGEKISRTEKDLKSVYKKIKRNKKYFISIKDIVVLESLTADGISLPQDLKYTELSSQLTVPKNLNELVEQNQLGLVMLKIVEIIGEDNIRDLDPETIYFLNRILNDLNLKKIRNNILREALPTRI